MNTPVQSEDCMSETRLNCDIHLEHYYSDILILVSFVDEEPKTVTRINGFSILFY